ncbi:type II secretion system F family protein [Candidatus Woesebacteria bacterium]|nr:type II secretion system F family protein [Candidatus Woesebacteria bacterium]
MKRFNYKAKDKDGKIVIGEVEASSIEHAARLVRNRGLIVLSLTPIKDSLFSFIKRFRSRVSGGEVTGFTRQLATMINAGLPITEALSTLRLQSRPSLQAVLNQVLADVEGGESLSTAMSKHPKVFSPTYIALIRSGEKGGVLDSVMSRLADDMEKSQEFRGKVKGALIYPAVIVVAMIVVGFIMVIFVIPKMTALYQEFGTELPFATKILIAVSDIAGRFWPIVILGLGGGFNLFRIYRKTKMGRRKTDELMLQFPIIGELQRKVLLTEVSRTLSLMVGSGVSILEGLTITANVVANSVISDALNDCGKLVEKGFPVAFAFARHSEAFPYIMSQMVAVGEETGKMEEVLSKVSHIFEVESDQKVKALTSAIEPLIMIILGVGVAFLVVAIILPIYNLTTSF